LAEWFKNKLNEAGFYVTNTRTLIIPVTIGDAKKAVELSENLLSEGIMYQLQERLQYRRELAG
jgi:7-keto-8-aminopelargonate synthetase-like enzyme